MAEALLLQARLHTEPVVLLHPCSASINSSSDDSDHSKWTLSQADEPNCDLSLSKCEMGFLCRHPDSCLSLHHAKAVSDVQIEFSTGFNATQVATVVAILQPSVVRAGTASPDMVFMQNAFRQHTPTTFHHILLSDGKTSLSSLNNSNHSLGLIQINNR